MPAAAYGLTLSELLGLPRGESRPAGRAENNALQAAVQSWLAKSGELPLSLAGWEADILAGTLEVRQIAQDHPAVQAEAWRRDALGFAVPTEYAGTAPRLSWAVPARWQEELWQIVEPLVAYARRQAADTLGVGASLLARQACDAWLRTPPGSLLRPLTSAFVLDMHAARTLTKDETGPDVRNWFWHHLAAIREQPGGRDGFLARYPLFARLLSSKLQGWKDAGLEFAYRLERDERAITTLLDAPRLTLRSVRPGAGDPHQGGRTVASVTFAEGRVAYRPRPVRSAIALLEFTALLRQRYQVSAAVFLPQIIDRGRYGWASWIEAAPCSDAQGMHRFYYRLGQLNGLAWLLGSNDLHAENIIACGDAPYLVDVDTLLTPVLPDVGNGAARIFAESPLSTGILPFEVDFGSGHHVEMSAYAGHSSGPGAQVTGWENPGTGEMRPCRERLPRPDLPSVPRTPNDQPADPFLYTDDFARGSAELFEAIAAVSRRLANDDAAWECWRGARTRVVLRNTAQYWEVSESLFHPAVLHNPFLAEGAFQVLLKRQALPRIAHRQQMFAVERAALLRGDVPYFETDAESHVLHACDGSVLADFLVGSPIAKVQTRLRRAPVAQAGLEWATRASLRAAEVNHKRNYGQQVCCDQPTRTQVPRGLLVEAATAIGRRLARLADAEGGTYTWLTLRVMQGGKWRVVPTDGSLYLGTLGILLFLDTLCELVPVDSEIAAVQRDLRRQWADSDPTTVYRGTGILDGLAGDLYVTRIFARHDKATDFTPRFSAIMDCLNDAPSGLDLLSGSAGIIVALCRMASDTPPGNPARAAILKRAEPHVHDLLSNMVDREVGASWDSLDGAPLTGFAHGSAGITYALSEFGRMTEGQLAAECLAAVSSADKWEASQFSERAANWPDLRKSNDPEPAWSCSWCNGSAGIGLAKAMRLRKTSTGEDKQQLRNDLEKAVVASVGHGLGLGQAPCHGDMGVAELLLVGAEALGHMNWAYMARRIGGMVAAEVLAQDGCIIQEFGPGVDLPGLINGAAGVGYELLRCAFGQRVPSILGLE